MTKQEKKMWENLEKTKDVTLGNIEHFNHRKCEETEDFVDFVETIVRSNGENYIQNIHNNVDYMQNIYDGVKKYMERMEKFDEYLAIEYSYLEKLENVLDKRGKRG